MSGLCQVKQCVWHRMHGLPSAADWQGNQHGGKRAGDHSPHGTFPEACSHALGRVRLLPQPSPIRTGVRDIAGWRTPKPVGRCSNTAGGCRASLGPALRPRAHTVWLAKVKSCCAMAAMTATVKDELSRLPAGRACAWPTGGWWSRPSSTAARWPAGCGASSASCTARPPGSGCCQPAVCTPVRGIWCGWNATAVCWPAAPVWLTGRGGRFGDCRRGCLGR